MAYDQQIQKQETEKSNIVNPKTKLTKVDMNFFENQIPSQITPSTLSDEPSSTMTTGSRSSTSDSRGMGMKKKSKDQAHLIVANGDGAQRIRSGDGMDGIHCRFTLWGYSRPWRASCASERRGE